jgi:two-component system phosphate regulon sensor histidine kinase PhoR
MWKSTFGRVTKSDWPLIGASVAVLFVYIYYTVNTVLLTPYPGITFTAGDSGWQINDSFQPDLEIDEVLVKIDDLSFTTYQRDRRRVPFEGFGPGDIVSYVTTTDGRELELEMPMPTVGDRFRRVLSTVWFFPFWIAGTVVLLFLRPRDDRWRLLVAFMYLTAIWVLAGSVSAWRIGSSRLLLGATAWLMIPIFIHLHLTVPSPFSKRSSRFLLLPLYITAILLAILEIFQVLPNELPLVANLIAIGGSVFIIIYRILRKSSPPSDKIALRLMLLGIGLAFGPGLLAITLPRVLGASAGSTLALSISLIAIPLLPILYTYAIYKRQLGVMELRVSRLLTLYSFALIYPTLFIVVLLLGQQWIDSAGARTIFTFVAAIVFVLATPPLLERFQKAIGRLAYGTRHDPDSVLQVFAKQIPSSLSRDSLVDLLTKEITPALLIRQSALYLLEDGWPISMYQEPPTPDEMVKNKQEWHSLLDRSGRYQPPDNDHMDRLSWVRLSIALVTRDETIGIWLLGRRDPDDFYPQNDIELLESLANQIAPMIENIRLYEALQQQADYLSEEVLDRTAELSAERDRTQAILDSAGDGIFFTDRLGIIQYTNPAMTQLSGYEENELNGLALDLWQSEDDSTEAYREMWTAIYNGREWGGELLLRHKDGTLRDVSLTLAPIQSDNGELAGFAGVQSDISKLKEVDRLKSSIITSVSHELKTPLTTIKTYLMLLQRGKPEKRDGYMGVLNRETDRLTNLIEDLLDLATLDTGSIPSRLEPLDMQIVANEVIVSSMPQANNKNISIKGIMVEGLPQAIADKSQIYQVLKNLVINAVNYSPQDSRIEIRAGTGKLDEEPAVWIKVSDNGPGIPLDEMPHLFERFYRGRAAQDGGARGTGLGLAICKEIIERHHGKLDVENAPGGGASFIVWLLAAPSRKPDHPSLPKTDAQQASRQTALSRKAQFPFD